MQLLLMRAAMWKCCKISSPHNSPVFLWMKTSYSSRMSNKPHSKNVNALFPNRVVSRNGDIPWPPSSPDLTPCNYFLWGYLKTKVFETRSRTIVDLKQRIQDEVAAIPVEMLRQVMNSFRSQLWGMRASRWKPSWGRYFQDINFQTGIKQNGYSYAFHLWPINRKKIHVSIFFKVLKFSCFIAQPCIFIKLWWGWNIYISVWMMHFKKR